jgi:hypothetical protein
MGWPCNSHAVRVRREAAEHPFGPLRCAERNLLMKTIRRVASEMRGIFWPTISSAFARLPRRENRNPKAWRKGETRSPVCNLAKRVTHPIPRG